MELGQLYWSTGLNTSGLKRDSAKAEGIIGKLGKGVAGSMGVATLGVGAIGAAAVKIGKDAFNFSKNFNAAMLEVKTISKAAQDDFSGLSEKIIDLSTLPIKDDAEGLSKAMYQIVSAGHDGADGLAVLEAAAKAATGGVTDTMTAADGLTTVMNAWGKSANEVNKISDVMFTTVKLGKTTMGELSSNIAQVAPLASSMGVSMEEVFAAVASITKQGVPTSQAMTQIRASLISMNDALGEGWNQNMTYQEGLQAIMDKAGGSQVELKNMMGRIEGVNAVLALTGDKAQGAADDFSAMTTSMGATNDAFETMSEDIGVKLQQATNNWNKALKGLGDNLILASVGLADFFNASMEGEKVIDIVDATNVDGFNDRMKLAKQSGLNFFQALASAAMQSDEKIKESARSASDKQIETYVKNQAERAANLRRIEDMTRDMDDETKRQKIENEIELTKKLQEERQKQLETLEGVKGVDAARSRVNLKKEQRDFEQYIKDLNDFLSKETESKVDVKTKLEIDPVIPPKTISDLENELKELEKLTGTLGDPIFEAKNLDKIKKKREQIDREWEKVRKARYGDLKDIKELESKTAEVKVLQNETMEATLDTSMVLTEEQQIQLDLAREQHNQASKNNDQYEVMLDTFEDINNKITAAIQIVDALAGAYTKLGGDMNRYVDEYLSTLESAATLAKNIANENWVGAIASGISLIGDFIDLFTTSMDELKAEFEDIFGFSADSITDSIVDGLMEGLEIAENGLGDFADTFGELMKEAGTNYLKQLFESMYLKDLMGKFISGIEREGGLSEELIEQFKEDYIKAVNEFKVYADAWRDISDELGFGSDTIEDSSDGISAAVQGITEETANLLEGQFNALRINTIDIIEIISEHGAIFEDIRDNTAESNNLLRLANSLLANMSGDTIGDLPRFTE